METLVFSVAKTEPVLQFRAGKSSFSFIACNSKEIVFINFDTSISTSLTTNSSALPMTSISGFYFDESSLTVYVFGDGLHAFTAPSMTLKKTISTDTFT